MKITHFSLSYDPDDDSMYLRVDWGSGSPGKWHGPFPSGTKVMLNYTWHKKGTFTIKAQAKDIGGLESDWGTLKVTMPKSKQSTTFFPWIHWFLERFPHAFPIIRQLIGFD